MKGAHFLVAFVLALSSSSAFAFDPSPLQDFCVANNDPKDGVFVNGKFCRDPMLATANDFSFSGLNIPRNTSNQVGSNVTLLNVDKIPGLNTLVAIAGLSSQNPGVITIANAVFGSNPPINPDVLAKAFQLDKNVVNYLEKQFWVNNQ
ncbi:hypothetical protein GH714_016151 [Hevea brasiliensis]|uniref:Cupin type-1 domain-containing protein n=1 Tax=Hevea brasiliensis TaxID=3981 RepID=A0A6A6K6J6_HEVBR|nr:hypothetical protein GH714_016151 [Hevea brasiliensis]